MTYEGVVCRAGYDVAAQPVWVEGLRGEREERVYDHDALTAVTLTDGAIEVAEQPTERSLTVDNGRVRLRTLYDGIEQPIFDEQGEYSTKISWDGGGIRELVSSVGTPLRYERGPDGEASLVLIGGMGAVRINERTPTGWVTRLGDGLALRRLYDTNGCLVWQALARIPGPIATLDGVAERNDPNLIVHDGQKPRPLQLNASFRKLAAARTRELHEAIPELPTFQVTPHLLTHPLRHARLHRRPASPHRLVQRPCLRLPPKVPAPPRPSPPSTRRG